ncbi:hypothetical protein BJ165DRAFT_176391 [Panaeolus papilionaceus]|nr:hypothetical protein BJ165DRAFT_176391 [Panaeolus papilionaceus]
MLTCGPLSLEKTHEPWFTNTFLLLALTPSCQPMKSRKTSFAAPTPEARGSPQIPPPQTENTRRKAPSRRKTQKGPATEGQCHFNGHDYPAWLGFDPQKPGGTFKHAFPAVDGDPWEGTMRMMNEHDDDVCDAWNDEIQNLLIFSGLFSAVVTAFAIETQKLLQPDPENATVLLLAQLSSHFLTDTTKTDKLAEPFLNSDPNRQTFRINCLMFSSLIISLGTALVGIIVLQWVRSYRNVEGGYDRDGIPMREARLKAFETWRVPTIIAYLPVSLGVSFIIFLVGLIDFLESLDPTVSAIIGALVSIIVVFLLVTTFLPGLHMLCSSHPFPFCAYQSAQSMLCCRLFTGFKCAKEWTTLISDLYKRSHENVRDEWLKDSLVGIFRRFNSAQAFRLAYLCFQSIPKDVSKNVNLRYDIVSEVIRDSKDLSKIGEEMMQSIASKGMLSSVASSEFFSLLLLLWNSRLGPDYALHRAELNFRCIQTFSHLPNPEYQKLIDLWWRKSAPEPSLADGRFSCHGYALLTHHPLQNLSNGDLILQPS